ncbi:hypothetical protein ACLK1S_18590 [Escherichia coli]
MNWKVAQARAISCGAAAVAIPFLLLSTGLHVLMTNTAYEPSRISVAKSSANWA